MDEVKDLTNVVCPKCGYRMPIKFEPHSECSGLYVVCKGRGCKTRFSITIKDGKQTK